VVPTLPGLSIPGEVRERVLLLPARSILHSLDRPQSRRRNPSSHRHSSSTRGRRADQVLVHISGISSLGFQSVHWPIVSDLRRYVERPVVFRVVGRPPADVCASSRANRLGRASYNPKHTTPSRRCCGHDDLRAANLDPYETFSFLESRRCDSQGAEFLAAQADESVA